MPPTPPSESDFNSFLNTCQAALPGTAIDQSGAKAPRKRCIGWDLDTSERICAHVIEREKTGTFSLPGLHDVLPETKPDIAMLVVLSNYDGVPRALLQTVGLELVTFGEIDESHTAIDGPSVRDLDVWRGIHTKYWNGLLEPYGKKVEDEMQVVVERFVCLHPGA